MGEILYSETYEQPSALSDPADAIDLRKPLGLVWYEKVYRDDPEEFADNVAQALVVALRSLEAGQLGTEKEEEIHGNRALVFVKEVVQELTLEEKKRSIGFTSLGVSFERHAGFNSPDKLASILDKFLADLSWYQANETELDPELRKEFQQRDEWCDTIYLMLYMAERRVDESLSKVDMTYQGASMTSWDNEVFNKFLAPYFKEKNHGPANQTKQKRGISGQVYLHLICEAHHRFRAKDKQATNGASNALNNSESYL